MAYKLEDINYRTVADPKGFIEESDAEYQGKIQKAADMIAENVQKSPIVLLAGPSGSGKTTTSMKVAETLKKLGVKSHYVGMDDYFLSPNPETSPRTAEGDYDLESPLCLDMDLLNEHFNRLADGEEIEVPKFDFVNQVRTAEPSKIIKPCKDEVVIFEGIHALNDMITTQHQDAFKLYISASSDVTFAGKTVFKRTWFRLVRRMVRDKNFRGTSADNTMSMWANVRRGEKAYISPFKDKANLKLDTSLPYEMPVMNQTASKLFASIPQGIERYDELRQVYTAIQLFGNIDESYVAKDSLIREFIGGGIYSY